MNKPQVFTQVITLDDGRTITLETGKFAKLTNGCVTVRMDDTILLAAVTASTAPREGIDFFPMSVDYQEKYAATGRFPGGFFKRENRLSDYEVLISRLVDRALRPLFADGFRNDVQVAISLISADGNVAPDALAGLAASAALSISDIPFEGPISEVRVAKIDGKLVINPYLQDMENATIDLIVSGSISDINMVEGEMKEVSEAEMLEAIKHAHEAIKIQCQAQIDFRAQCGKTKMVVAIEQDDAELMEKVRGLFATKLHDICINPSSKQARTDAFAALLDEHLALAPKETDEEKAYLSSIKKYYSKLKKEVMRNMVLDHRVRLDGRKLNEVRGIWAETDLLPTVHGSALFQRGETQCLASVTLGTKLDEQMVDGALFKGYNKFLLHYNFPGFSTGEVKQNRGPARREVGHGNLALRALKPMLPSEEVNPYTVRITADIMESNGSSSMATVCAGCLAMLDAGIKLKKSVSGIAMGLISGENGKYAVLSDILGDEDHLGDMDFKVTGTADGITACQMDLKVDGLSYSVVEEALMQAREGRLHILDIMNSVLPIAREDYKSFVPRMERFTIDKDFIGAVIGKGGSVIQEIQKVTGATISIDEIDGMGHVEVSSADKDALDKAVAWIQAICTTPDVGATYHGKVVSIQAFGAFVEFLPGKEGLLHISEISYDHLRDMEGVLSPGDEVDVKLLEIDQRTGKFRLSIKALLPKPEGYVERPPREERPRDDRRGGGRDDRRGGGGRDDRGPRRDDRGPRRDDRGPRRDDNNSERPQRNEGGNNAPPATDAPSGDLN